MNSRFEESAGVVGGNHPPLDVGPTRESLDRSRPGSHRRASIPSGVGCIKHLVVHKRLLGDHSRRSRGPRHRPAGGSRCVAGPGRKLPWARSRRRQKARHGRRGGISASAVAARVQLATPAFAHTWLTLRPSVAGRLVLPGRAPAAQGAPVLRPAICESTGGKLGVPQRPRYRKFG